MAWPEDAEWQTLKIHLGRGSCVADLFGALFGFGNPPLTCSIAAGSGSKVSQKPCQHCIRSLKNLLLHMQGNISILSEPTFKTRCLPEQRWVSLATGKLAQHPAKHAKDSLGGSQLGIRE